MGRWVEGGEQDPVGRPCPPRSGGQPRAQPTVAGTPFTPVRVPVKPAVAVPPGGRAPFQAALRTVTFAPVWVWLPFHSWDTVWPFGNVQVTVQPVMAVAPLRM